MQPKAPIKRESAPPDHVPGPMQEAAVRTFFERGSKQAIERNHWRLTAIVSLCSTLVIGILATVVLSQKEVLVMQVSKGSSGDLQAAGTAKVFAADDEAQMAWAISYAQILSEISPAIWRRNVDRVVRLSSGVAVDQVRTYLNRANTNPAALLQKDPLYVREFHRKSVNKVANGTYLVRYDLISRSAPNAASVTHSFAMTITVAQTEHKTREDVFFNPAGLVAMNFSISDETQAPLSK